VDSDPLNEPFVSAVNVWEIAIERSLGKLAGPDVLPDRIADDGFLWRGAGADRATLHRHR
jgi:hypothetical protein